MKDYHKYLISSKSSIRSALIQLDRLGAKNTVLFVIDDQAKLLGTITDGDIRRGLITDVNIQDTVDKVMHEEYKYLKKNTLTLEYIRYLREELISILPFIDENHKLLKIIDFRNYRSFLPLDVVLMAGGKGERLRPLTNTVPKPLLKVGKKPIIEHNIDRLISFGIDHFHLSIRYLGDKLIEYFGKGETKGVQIDYITETHPLGTIGAVKQIKNFSFEHILVMNSDLLTNIDYEALYTHFIDYQADMVVATIPYQVNVPYGVLETNEGNVIALKEKPTYTYYSNAGIYIFKKTLLDFIPENEFFNATDLMQTIMGKGLKLTHFPILGYWLDIGKPEDFEKAQRDVKYINL
jgi:dTDP-glucose pyrophosphorylase/CBS domain-containing protein